MAPSSEIKFSVRYDLGEYLGIVKEHAFDTADALRELRGFKRKLSLFFLQSFATVMFLYKSARVGQCDFTINSESVTRQSKSATGSVSWSKVKIIHSYNLGYLIELESGAMPIPYRVLSDIQRDHFLKSSQEI